MRQPNGARRSGTLLGSHHEPQLSVPTITVICAIVLLVATGVWLYLQSRRVAVPTDAATLCPTDRPLSEVDVILLDISDQFSEPQRLQVENDLLRVRDRIPRFGMVEVYTVDRLGRRVTEPVLRVCNPGTGEDLSRIYQNPALARKKWGVFTEKLSAAIDSQMSGQSLETSPLFEAIQATALRTFGDPEYDAVPKRLVIVSDFLQNVPGELSMYDSVPLFEVFERTPYFSRVRSDLRSVKVFMSYLVRANSSIQGRTHVSFWEGYFRSQGAVVESVDKVFGDK